jgi:hypothetical protein
MSLIDKLNARIRNKVTPEIIARAEKGAAAIGEPKNWDINDSMWAFSHRAAAEQAAAEPAVGLRM